MERVPRQIGLGPYLAISLEAAQEVSGQPAERPPEEAGCRVSSLDALAGLEVVTVLRRLLKI